MHLDVCVRLDERLVRAVEAIATALTEGNKHMADTLAALTAQVQANNDLLGSAVALIQGLAKQIQDNKNNPAALQALVDSLKSKDAELAQAIAANTPADDTTGGDTGGTGDTGATGTGDDGSSTPA